MLTFHITLNPFSTLHFQEPPYIPENKEIPIRFVYTENVEISKREIINRLNKHLRTYGKSFLRPIGQLTGEWLINLDELKYEFDCLKSVNYLKGKTQIEPEYFQEEITDKFSNEIIGKKTIIKFTVYPDEVERNITGYVGQVPYELKIPLQKFNMDFTQNDKCGFLMMKFEDSKIQKEITNSIRKVFSENKITILRADDKHYADDLLNNIRTYMHGCDFGIALFERINSNYFNPNVSLEIGYMMAMSKPLLILKDKTLDKLPSDLVGRLYLEFDFQEPEKSLRPILEKWMNNHELI